MNQKSGQVYLVGAGIGDKNYLTLSAYNILSQAQVLIYDALVDTQLASITPSDCLKIDVGKRGGKPSTPQIEINQLLVKYCQEGKIVVRLKSGDPFIFGRANEEIAALDAANCPYTLIPGLSSALTAPLLAGIPLTDKHLSKAFTVLTGHDPKAYNWEALAQMDTLVILMGGRNLAVIIQELIAVGKAVTTPVAIIRDAGCPQQKIWRGTLATIIAETNGISLSPTVIVIGEVAQLGHTTVVNQSLPLQGQNILVTRSAGQSSSFRALLEAEGATVMEMPALEIRPPSSWEALDEAIEELQTFDWLIFTSSNGVNYFRDRVFAQNKDFRILAGLKIAVVGKKTAATLEKHNLTPDYIPPHYIADSLVNNFPESLKGQKILFPRVETGGRELLVKELTNQGAKVKEVPAYQSACPETITPEVWLALQTKQINIITFASSKTVKNFHKLLDQALSLCSESSIMQAEGKPPTTIEIILDSVYIASIGPETSSSCYELMNRVDIEAEEYTLEGLTQAIVKLVTEQDISAQEKLNISR